MALFVAGALVGRREAAVEVGSVLLEGSGEDGLAHFFHHPQDEAQVVDGGEAVGE